MTKMKSKKMTKSTFAIIIMAIAMVAMLAFGGTYAFFTANAYGAKGTTTTAKIQLTSDFTSDNQTISAVKSNTLPGETIFAIDSVVTDASTRNSYVFASVKVTFGSQVVNLTAEEQNILNFTWGQSNVWTETVTVDTVTDGTIIYCVTRTNEGDSAQADAIDFELTITLDPDLAEEWAQGEEEGALKYMGKEVTVTVDFYAVQQSGFETDKAGAYKAAVANVGK